MKKLFFKVLGTPKYSLVIGCDQDQFNELERSKFYGLNIPIRETSPWTGNYPVADVEPQARIIAAPVAFNSMGFKTVNSTDPLSPALLVSKELMENVVLHKEIREKGGAYGSGASYTPSTGNFNFFSYRDPHLARTVSIFDEALQKIAAKEFSDRELEEAKLRQGRSFETRKEFRQRVLDATPDEIAESLKQHLIGKNGTLVSFLGKELLDKEQKQLKNPLKVIPI